MSTLWKLVSLVTLAAVIVLAAAVGYTMRPVAAAQSAATSAATGTETNTKTISISAQGQVYAKPDVAYISLGVRTVATTAQDAIRQNSASVAAVIAKLESMGVAKKDMQTGNISLYPQTTTPKDNNGPDVITGYTTSNTLKVTVTDLTKVGELLDAAIAAGANSVSGVRFSIKEDSKIRDQALTEAVKTARAKADLVAEGLGLKVTGVESVSVESYVGGSPVYAEAAAGMRDSAMSVPVEPGEVSYTASVRVTFSF